MLSTITRIARPGVRIGTKFRRQKLQASLDFTTSSLPSGAVTGLLCSAIALVALG